MIIALVEQLRQAHDHTCMNVCITSALHIGITILIYCKEVSLDRTLDFSLTRICKVVSQAGARGNRTGVPWLITLSLRNDAGINGILIVL